MTTPDRVRPEITLDAFLEAARTFLDSTCARRELVSAQWEWGDGDDRDVAIWDEVDRSEQSLVIAEARRWRRARFDAGFGWIDGDVQAGGAGLPASFRRAYQTLERQYTVPDQSFFKLDRVIGPVLMKTDDSLHTTVAGMFRGDVIVCELFSEAGAGSDILSLRTRAERSAQGWCINGTKNWIIDAHYADLGIVLARTDESERGSAGLTAFLVDLDADGVEIRPLRLMTGGLAFNAVTLQSVTVPDSHRLGAVGDGWKIAREILRREQGVIGGAGFARSGSGIANGVRLTAMVKARGLGADSLVRQGLAEVHSNFWMAKQLTSRATDSDRTAGDDLPSPILGKLSLSANLRAVAHFVSDALGPDLSSDNGDWGSYAWNSFILGEPGIHLFAGTDEIVRNIIGENVLRLEREPRVVGEN